MATLTACLVIIAVWVVLGAVLVGLGRGARRLITGTAEVWSLGDFWTGLAVLISLLMVAHLAFPVRGWLWVIIAPLAVLGLLLRPRPLIRPGRTAIALLAVGAVVAVYVADRAQQGLGNYDSGLYHLPMLEWLHTYRAVPGLANIQGRFGYNTGSLMFDAVIGTAAPARIVQHLGNSLLMAAALLEVILVLPALWRRSATVAQYAPGVLLVLSLPAVLIPLHNNEFISSPSPDLPAVVITLVAAYYVARVVTAREPAPHEVVPTVALLALMPVIRVQLVVFTVVAGLVLIASCVSRRIVINQLRRQLPWLVGLSVFIVGSWAVHGIVLSGYPSFPVPLLGLPVPWKVPLGWTQTSVDITRAWAREPGVPTAQVLASSAWHGPWSVRMATDPQIRGMMLLAGLGNIALAVFALLRLVGQRGPASRRAVAAGVGLVVAVLATALLVHYVRQPMLRPMPLLKVSALLTIVGIAALVVLAAIALARDLEGLKWVVPAAVLGVAGAASCIAWYVAAPEPRFATGILWLTAAVPAGAFICWLWTWRRNTAAVLLVATVVVASVIPVRDLQKQHLLALDHAATGPSTWGLSTFTLEKSGPQVKAGTDGVLVNTPPAVGSDLCWTVPLPCTPYPMRPWRLRDPGHLSGGFEMTRDFTPGVDQPTP